MQMEQLASGHGAHGAVKSMLSQHMQQMYMDHLHTLWTQFGVIALGAWLLASPMMLGYLDPGSFGPQVACVTQERGLGPSELRAQAMMWSDLAASGLLIAFGFLSLWWRQCWAQWGTCLTGIWLLFAPLVFWAPDAASTNNDWTYLEERRQSWLKPASITFNIFCGEWITQRRKRI